MELIVVTPPDYFEGEGRLFNQLFAEGLGLLHIRKPINDAGKFRELMMEIKPEYHPAISIHQHHELADEFSLRRLHYTEKHRQSVSPVELDELRGEGFCLSSSVHDLENLPDLDYVFFGPVFNSISKTGYESQLSADFAVPPHQTRIFAIGGVSAGRLAQLKQMNFDGAAVLGTLWHQQDSPLAEFKKLKKAINNL
jgi:thiamine-phosphate pyrophosphorylase